jgi:hypothetical protein
MTNTDSIRVPAGSSDHVLESGNGETLVVQQRSGNGTSTFSSIHMVGLSSSSTYRVQWFDPQNGGGLQTGSIGFIVGGALNVPYGVSPHTRLDWIILLRKV